MHPSPTARATCRPLHLRGTPERTHFYGGKFLAPGEEVEVDGCQFQHLEGPAEAPERLPEMQVPPQGRSDRGQRVFPLQVMVQLRICQQAVPEYLLQGRVGANSGVAPAEISLHAPAVVVLQRSAGNHPAMGQRASAQPQFVPTQLLRGTPSSQREPSQPCSPKGRGFGTQVKEQFDIQAIKGGLQISRAEPDRQADKLTDRQEEI